MELKKLQKIVIKAIEDLKASEITLLDVQDLTSITDLMIICNGTSNRHVKSIANNIVEQVKAHGVQPLGAEGINDSDWALIDLGDIIVHVMRPETRDFYNLETLWTAAIEEAKTRSS